MSSSGPTWLGLDVGTQSVRCLVVGDDGEVHGSGTAPLSSRRDGRCHEQDPDEWWRACVAAIRGAADDGADLASVRALAVDATSGTVTLVEESGTPLAPALMYDDARAVEETARAAALATELTDGAPGPTAALGRVAWLVRAHAARVEQARVDGVGLRLAHQADVVNGRLVGRPVATDTSTALKTGVDPEAVAWPHDLIAAMGVPDDVLPPVVLPGTVLGTVGAGAAAETGLPRTAEVVAGMTDGCASQLGAGVVEVGSWNSVLGTTLVIKGVTSQRLVDPRGVVYSHRSPAGGWLPGGASSVGAGMVSREFADDDLADLSDRAARALPTDVLRYPLVSPGERFPFGAPEATDLLIGAPADRAEAFAALLQGTAYAERLCFDVLDLLGAGVDGDGEVVLTGGGSRNETWTQLRADVLGRPVTRVRTAEAALGMAVLARGRGTGLVESARSMVHRADVVEPTGDARAGVPAAEHVEGYLRLVGALEERGWLPEDLAGHARRRSGS